MAKLLTKAIETKLRRFPIKSQEARGADAEVLVKFFYPYGSGTWLATEAEYTEDDGWIFYGIAEIGHGWEWGYFSLNELAAIKKFGRPAVERERYAPPKTVKEAWADA